MFELPDLPYGYAALTPDMSEATLRTHHGKHHARYVAATNALLAELRTAPESLEDVVGRGLAYGDRKLFNNAAQAWNHGFFWACMVPGGSRPSGALAEAIEAEFGSLDALKTLFMAEASGHFGSGWAWLIARDSRLAVISTHDAEPACVFDGVTPLLVCDLWEHAYYLDHRSDRARFLTAWWDGLVNWPFAEREYAAARGEGVPWRYPAPVQGARRAAGGEPPRASSPVCYASDADADAAYMGFIEHDALVGELNTLLEAERAGAAVAARMVAEAREAKMRALAQAIHGDELHWCRELLAALGRLGAEPSPSVGGFYEHAMAIPELSAGLAFVNRGQGWVVRRLRKLLPRIRDDALHSVLREMLAAHERNIAAANSLLDRRPGARA